jgi:hypothetical protein
LGKSTLKAFMGDWMFCMLIHKGIKCFFVLFR